MVSEMLPGDPLRAMLPHGAVNWIELALATPVVVWGGWPFFERGWASIVSRHLNMFTLIALGVGAAFGYSVVATVAPGVFPDAFRIGREVAVYFEPAAVQRLLAKCRSGQATGFPDNMAFVGILSTMWLDEHFIRPGAAALATAVH